MSDYFLLHGCGWVVGCWVVWVVWVIWVLGSADYHRDFVYFASCEKSINRNLRQAQVRKFAKYTQPSTGSGQEVRKVHATFDRLRSGSSQSLCFEFK
jgi:hypothetical protein